MVSATLKSDLEGTLTDRVASRLRERIGSGELRPGDNVPSERELSRQMKVSRVTARNGLKQLVEAGFLRREAGRGYFVRSVTEPDRRSSSGTALVFVHAQSEQEMSGTGEHARMWVGAREEAARAGRLMLVSPLEQEIINAEKAKELASVAAGVIADNTNEDSIRMLLKAGLPVVLIHYYRNGIPVDSVVQDDMGGIRQAVQHLVSRGHKRIAYLDTSRALRQKGRGRNSEMRLAGYTSARASFELDEDKDLIIPITSDCSGAAARLLAVGATAVVSPHTGIWLSAREGVDLPEDFGVVVWGDENIESKGIRSGYPTSVSWSREQMGREAARRLLSRIENPDLRPITILVSTELKDRGTGGRGPFA